MAAFPPTPTIVSDPYAFHALAAEWDRLVEQSPHRSYFRRWHWNWLWWQHLAPPNARLFLILCRDRNEALIGLAPLYLRTRRLLSMLRVRELHLLGMGVPLKTSECVDLIARPGAEAEVAEAVAAALRQNREWDELCLAGVPSSSPLAGRLLDSLGVGVRMGEAEAAPYIDTSRGWDHYKQTLGRSMRRNVEYYSRRLFQQHACTFERITSAEAIPKAIDDLIRLHQARWQNAGEPGSFASPQVVAFLHESAMAAHACGLLRLWVLRINGQTEAALIGYLDNGVMHYFQKGFNPDWAKADLGTVIVSLAVKACCDEPAVQMFDFMSGAGYKTMWARDTREIVRYDAWRLNPRTIARRAWDASLEATARVYRAAAPRALREARRRRHRQRRLDDARALTAAKSSSEA